MPKPLFHGVFASTSTPFNARGDLQLDRVKPHIDWILADGAHAISPLGSSGEFTALEIADRKRVLEAVLAANAGRVPVVAGTHHYSTRLTIDLSRHAQQAGADALLIVPPYYMALTPSQVMEHYRRIAESVSIPIVVYHNIPLTAVDLKAEHLLKLYEEGTIAGIKMSNPEPDRICELLQATDGKLQFSAYHSRGDGAHWFSVMKATLNMIGPPVGDPAPPVLPLGEPYRGQLARILTDLGYQLGV